MTPRRVVALAQALTMTMLLVPGPIPIGPGPVEAAPQPEQPGVQTLLGAEGTGIGCQTSGTKYRGPGLPKDPPWPPGSEPTPSPTPQPSLSVDDPALDAGSSPEASPSPSEPSEASAGVSAATATVEHTIAAGELAVAQAVTKPKSKLLTGIDVSHHNGDIDYQAVKQAGHAFVFIKATQDIDFVDPMFPTNLARARAAGLAAGAYHFFDYTLDGREQADHFIDRLEAAGGIDDALPPVVDVECWAPIGSSIHAVAAARLRDFVQRVYERIGRMPLVYTSVRMWSEVVGNADGFEELPMWAACWGCDQPISVASGWGGWVFWQEGLTRIPGVGRLDGNYFAGSKKELKALKLRPLALAGGDAVTGGGQVELDLGGRDATHLRTSLDGETWTEWSRIRSAPTATIPHAEGHYEVYAQLRNGPGLKSPVVSVDVIVDATAPEVSPPTVALRSGILGSDEASVPVSVRWDASDATAGLTDGRVELSCGDGRVAGTDVSGSSGPGERASWSAEVFAFPAADCSVTAVGVDAAGNSGRAATSGVTTTVVSADGAVPGATVSGDEVGVIATRGPGGGRVAVLLDGQAIGLLELYALDDEPAAIVFVADLPAGEHTISVEPTDESGVTLGGVAAVDGFVTLTSAG
jgi:lysozyme